MQSSFHQTLHLYSDFVPNASEVKRDLYKEYHVRRLQHQQEMEVTHTRWQCVCVWEGKEKVSKMLNKNKDHLGKTTGDIKYLGTSKEFALCYCHKIGPCF